MQTFITSFASTMSWLILGLACVSVALLSLEGRRFQQGRRRAFMELVAMLVVLVASTASLIVLTVYLSSGHSTPAISQWLLPLVASTLLVALYRLSFPPSQDHPSSRRAPPQNARASASLHRGSVHRKRHRSARLLVLLIPQETGPRVPYKLVIHQMKGTSRVRNLTVS